MFLHRARSDIQLASYLGVGSPARNMIEDLRLPLGDAEALEPLRDTWRRRPDGHPEHGRYNVEEQEIPVCEVDAVAGTREIVNAARSEEARSHAVVEIERSQDSVVDLKRMQLSQRYEVG